MYRPSKFIIGSGIVAAVLLFAAIATAIWPVNVLTDTSTRGSIGAPSAIGLGMPGFATAEVANDSAAFLMKGRPIMPPVPSPTGGETAAETDQKIIKTGSLDLAVASVDETVSKLRVLAAGKGGFVQDASVNERNDGTKFGSLVLRVPANQFDAAIEEAKKLAALVKSETTNGQDVTEQYSDLQAQLRNAQAQETEYLAILKKAQTVQDILNVQQYLGNIRSTIESLQGRIKYLSNQTSYSTLAISLSEDTKVRAPSQGFRPLEDIKAAAQAFVLLAESLLSWLIWAVIVGGGILIPIALIVWGIIALIRRFMRR